MGRRFFLSVYAFTGAILWTLGIWYLPVVWWVKILIWAGGGMLINTNSLEIKHLFRILAKIENKEE